MIRSVDMSLNKRLKLAAIKYPTVNEETIQGRFSPSYYVPTNQIIVISNIPPNPRTVLGAMSTENTTAPWNRPPA